MEIEREVALRLACECASTDGSPVETVNRARTYLAFLNGDADAQAAVATRAAEDLSSATQRRGF